MGLQLPRRFQSASYAQVDDNTFRFTLATLNTATHRMTFEALGESTFLPGMAPSPGLLLEEASVLSLALLQQRAQYLP